MRMASQVNVVVFGILAACIATGYAVDVGEVCANNADCPGDSTCEYDGSNGEITRCECKYGYLLIGGIGSYSCAKIIHSDIDVNCEDCEDNGATCYDSTGDDLKDGCMCASFVTGVDCTKSHVNVSCDVDTFTMVVCYEPQDAYNFSAQAIMVAESFPGDMACVSVAAGSADPQCPLGNYKLTLPLTASKRDRCDTHEYTSDITTTTYENIILVQKSPDSMNMDDVSFRATCSFDTHANGVFEPIGLAVAARDGRGDHHKATLAMYVETQLGNAVPEGVALRLGDKIRFKILLTADGTYAAIRVLRCIASTRPTTPDPNAVTLPLILGSCPSPNQNHITDLNNWVQISSKPNELKTGLLRMFKMSEGRSVHIHCAVKLCLKGSESDCGPVSCSSPNAHTSYGRKKRAIASDPTSLMVSRELTWFEQENGLQEDTLVNGQSSIDVGNQSKLTGNSAMMYGLVGASLGFIVVVVVTLLVIKVRKSIQTKDSQPNDLHPQLALPSWYKHPSN